MKWVDEEIYPEVYHLHPLEFPKMMREAIHERGYGDMAVVYEAMKSSHPLHGIKYTVVARVVEQNVVIQKHHSVAPRATLDAALNDAARQAYGVFCHDHHGIYDGSARRYLPRRQSGEVAHEIAPLEGGNA